MNMAATPAAVALLERVADGIGKRVTEIRRTLADPLKIGAAALPLLALAAVRAPLTMNITRRHTPGRRTSFIARELLNVLRHATHPQIFGGQPFDAAVVAGCEQTIVVYLLGELLAAGRANALENDPLERHRTFALDMITHDATLYHATHAYVGVKWSYFATVGGDPPSDQQMLFFNVLEGLVRSFCAKFGAAPVLAPPGADAPTLVEQFRAATQAWCSADGLILGATLSDAASRLYQFAQFALGQTAPTLLPVAVDVGHFGTPVLAISDPELVALL